MQDWLDILSATATRTTCLPFNNLRSRERFVGVRVEEDPRLGLERIELAVLAVRKGILAVEADRRIVVLEHATQVVKERRGQRNRRLVALVVMGGLERSALDDLVDDIVRIVRANDLEFGGGLLVGENGIVHRHAGHDARHHRPDQCYRHQDRERNGKNESPGKAAATLRRAALDWLKQNRRMAHGGWPNVFWTDAGPSTIYVKEALTMRLRPSGLGICVRYGGGRTMR